MDRDVNDDWRKNLNYVKRKWSVKEDVVISGISGRFPKSESVQEFKENLFNKIDMLSSGNERFPSGIYGFPFNSGKVENLEKFDAEFFNIKETKANLMDPQLRKLLEVSYEAIIDAGLSMEELKGSNTGFFYGSSFQETDMAFSEDPFKVPPHNQIYTTLLSYVYDLHGPIAQFDTACGSSFAALNEAFLAIKSGICDRALVAGYNICLVPVVTLQFRDLKMVSITGKSKCLDDSADGYGRSEAVCCIVLQRKPEAKRIYSTIVNSRSNTDGFKEQGINFPSAFMQRKLMAETYDEVGLDPNTVKYVEAHTTGTQVGDPVELKAIYDVFCPERSTENPLLVGCLKSNMGHSEAASGLCAMIKANMVFQTGLIPPNILFKKPNHRIEGLNNGKIKPIIETTQFDEQIISLNCFGFGGSNVHVILKGNPIKSSKESYNIADDIPRLVTISNRSLRGVAKIQDFLQDNHNSLTREFLDLLNSLSKDPRLASRGYTLISKNNGKFFFKNFILDECRSHSSTKVFFSLPNEPLKFEQSFNQIPVFTEMMARIDSCVKILDPQFPQLSKLLCDSPLDSAPMCLKSVATVAGQLILVHLLNTLKVPIDGIIGHSLGQLTYAYIQGIIPLEKVIFAAYWLGHFMDHEASSIKCIEKVDHNQNEIASSQNNFLSQKYFNISDSIVRMKLNGYEQNFGRDPNCNSLKSLISELLKFVDYYSNKKGLRKSPTNSEWEMRISENLYRQALNQLPCDSILLDFSSSQLKRVDNQSTFKQITPISSDAELKIAPFLESIGTLFCSNVPCDPSPLYPKTCYPVPVDTLSLNSLISWCHSRDWKVFKYPEYFNHLSPKSSFLFKVNLSNAEDWFYSDHKIDKRTLFPATGMLMFAWNVAASYECIPLLRTKVLFRDVAFSRATVLSPDKEVRFKVQYQPYNGSFYIVENDAVIASGKVFLLENIHEVLENYEDAENKNLDSSSLVLSHEDVYKELRIRGYDYGPSFRCIKAADQHGRNATIEWKEVSAMSLQSGSIMEKTREREFSFLKSWVTFSDSVLQLSLLANRFERSLFVPTGIETMVVDPQRVLELINEWNREKIHQNREEKANSKTCDDPNHPKEEEKRKESHLEFRATQNLITRTLVTPGLWVRGLKASLTQRRPQKTLLETYEFVPFNEQNLLEKGLQEKLSNYNEKCIDLINYLKKGVKLSEQEKDVLLGQYDLESDAHSFISLLVKVCEDGVQACNDFPVSKLALDILVGNEMSLSTNRRFLAPLVNVSLGQQTYCGHLNSNFSVIEYNEGRTFLFEIIRSFVENQSVGTVRLNCTVAAGKFDSQANDFLSGKVNKIVWDPEQVELPGETSRADLLIYKNFSSDIETFQKRLDKLVSGVKPEGNLLVILQEKPTELVERAEEIAVLSEKLAELKNSYIKSEDVIDLMGQIRWKCVSKKHIDDFLAPITGLLFKKVPENLEIPEIISVSPFSYEWTDQLKAKLEEKKTSPIWLVADQRFDTGVVGLVRSIGLESGGERVFCVANRYPGTGVDLHHVDLERSQLREILESGMKFNVFDPQLGWGEYVHMEIEEKQQLDVGSRVQVSNCQLECFHPGDLSSLVWCDLRLSPSSNSHAVNVCYAPLNFKDVMLATGRLPIVLDATTRYQKRFKVPIGLEYAGYDQNGNRVMGMVASGAMATKLSVDPLNDFLWPVPEDWRLEDAATVPVVYGTAIYALIMRGNLLPGESVLIHAGSGGVGLAAITICLQRRCTVFTTVGSVEKRRFLLERFPDLQAENIGNSRDTTFEEMIYRRTDGRGVDIVLNSLADDKLQASLRCLAPGGRFLEIGKYDAFKNSSIDIGWLDNGRSFQGVMLDAFWAMDETQSGRSALDNERQRLKATISEFFQRKIIKPIPKNVFPMDRIEDAFRFMASGKHIGKVIIKIREGREANEPIPQSISLLRIAKFYPEKSYIIIGGFGGFGMEIALWIAYKGARTIVLNSRSGPKSTYHRYCIDRLHESGVNVIISKHDLTSEDAVHELIQSCPSPVGGIFNSALVLSDALFSEQTPENFVKVCDPKIKVTYNFDKISRKLCPQLDYFVVFSSVTSGRGNIGQTNYGFANSHMESLCERRRRDGLHGLAIQWGFIGDVGYVVERMGANVDSIRGTAAQRLHSCFSILDRALEYTTTTISSLVRSVDKTNLTESSGDIIKSISHILGIKNIYALDPKTTLGELGMDSLMAIEVQQALERNFNYSVTTKEIRNLNIADLISLSKKFSQKGSVSESGKRNSLGDLQKELQNAVLALPTEPIVKLKTSESKENIFVLPPIEGDYKLMSDLLEKLNANVTVLNWTYDFVSYTTMEQAASHLVNEMEKLVTGKVSLIGYSFGGILAMALVTELNNRNSQLNLDRLVLLDADAEKLRTATSNLAASQAVAINEDTLEIEFIKGSLRRYMKDIDDSQLDSELKAASSRTERFNIAASFMAKHGMDSEIAEKIMKINELTLQKGRLAYAFQPSLPQDCQIVHLRAKEDLPILQDIAQSMQNVGKQYYFDGNHHNFIEKNCEEMSKIINDFLLN